MRPSATTYGVQVNGVGDVDIDGGDFFAGASTPTGVRIENNALNVRIKVQNLRNVNNITILNDLLNGFNAGTGNLAFYSTPDFGIYPFRGKTTLPYSASIAVDASAASYFEIDVTNASAYTINNPTNLLPGMVLTFEIVNSTGGAIAATTWGGNFAFKDATSALQPAAGKRRVITWTARTAVTLAQNGAATGDM